MSRPSSDTMAAMKKAQLARVNANALRQTIEKDYKNSSSNSNSNSNSLDRNTPRSSGLPNDGVVSLREQFSVQSKDSSAEIHSYQNSRGLIVAERIIIRPTAQQKQQAPSHGKALSQLSSSSIVSNRATLSRREAEIESEEEAIALAASLEGVTFSSQFSQPVNSHCPWTSSHSFLVPPIDPAGRRFDLADRPITCSSSNKRNEVIVGSADHSLYSIDVTDPRKKPIQMYSKTSGHNEWVTSVAHMVDGRVLSAGMDGRLCLWELDRRRCSTVTGGHQSSITKILADARNNIAVALGYDGTITAWTVSDQHKQVSKSTTATISSIRSKSKSNDSSDLLTPMQIYSASAEPISEADYLDGQLFAGTKAGTVQMWDLETSTLKQKMKAHPGPVTSVLLPLQDNNDIFMTGSVDGYVKLWDTRIRGGSGLVMKSLTHYSTSPAAAQTGASMSMSTGPRGPRGRIQSSQPAAPASTVTGMAVSNMAACLDRGLGSLNYVITTGADNRIAVLDARQSFRTIETLDYHKGCIYSLCIVGSDCIVTGDGAGLIICYDLVHRAIKYGIGASEVGAVKTINCVDGKIVTGGEDGNAIVFSFR